MSSTRSVAGATSSTRLTFPTEMASKRRDPWWWKHLNPRAIWNVTRLLNEAGPLVVTSAYRTVTHNARVHGVPGSRHTLGQAVDLFGTERVMRRAAALARELGAVEVIIHDTGSGLHLHVAWE